jgi:hypothetical protein
MQINREDYLEASEGTILFLTEIPLFKPKLSSTSSDTSFDFTADTTDLDTDTTDTSSPSNSDITTCTPPTSDIKAITVMVELRLVMQDCNQEKFDHTTHDDSEQLNGH